MKIKTFTLKYTEDELSEIREFAKKQNMTMDAVFRESVKEYQKKRESKPPVQK